MPATNPTDRTITRDDVMNKLETLLLTASPRTQTAAINAIEIFSLGQEDQRTRLREITALLSEDKMTPDEFVVELDTLAASVHEHLTVRESAGGRAA